MTFLSKGKFDGSISDISVDISRLPSNLYQAVDKMAPCICTFRSIIC